MDRLSLYHKLPYPLKSLAASLHGYRLRSQRYGKDAEHLIEEALDRERWSWKEWQSWQQALLGEMLDLAAKHVPYYRAYWDERRRQGDRASWVYLENWPVLKKDPLRRFPKAFVAEGADFRSLIEEHTSGTTGTPLTLWRNLETERQWYALYEARVRRWNGFSYHDRWAILGAQPVIAVTQRHPPFWVWNGGLNQLYLSAIHVGEAFISAYVEALWKYRVRYILGYPFALALLVRLAEKAGLVLPRLEAVITNSEILLPEVRRTLSHSFKCRVVDTYGMSETVAAASECQFGRMHIWPDAGIVEILRDEEDRSVGELEPGRLILTGLLNPVMPLIRYEIGDRGRWSPDPTECECGRQMPTLAEITGRMDDILLSPDGRRIDAVIAVVFKADLPIREAQVIQKAIDLLEIRVVPEDGFSEKDAEILVRRIKKIAGESMNVDIVKVDAIPRGPNGKFRFIVSLLDHSSSLSL